MIPEILTDRVIFAGLKCANILICVMQCEGYLKSCLGIQVKLWCQWPATEEFYKKLGLLAFLSPGASSLGEQCVLEELSISPSPDSS